MGTTNPSPSHVVVAFDATKGHNERELRITIADLRVRGDILRFGDTLVMLGVLHRVTHPMGYQSLACPEIFGTSIRAMEEEVSRKVDRFVNMLQQIAEDCKDQGVSIEVKITAGIPIKDVVKQEVLTFNAAWVILDRHFRRDLRSFVKQLPCKVALVHDSLNVEVLRNHTIRETDAVGNKPFYSISKPIHPQTNFFVGENIDQSEISVRSYSFPLTSTESSKNHYLMPSLTLKSKKHSLSSDFMPSSKQEKSVIASNSGGRANKKVRDDKIQIVQWTSSRSASSEESFFF